MADTDLKSSRNADNDSQSEIHQLVESAIAQRHDECEKLEKLCKQLENNKCECMPVTHFEIKNHGSFDHFRKELAFKNDSEVVLNLWKLSFFAAFQKTNSLPGSIDIKEHCISLTLTLENDFEKVIEFLHPLAQKLQCINENVKDYFASLDPPTEDDLQQLLKSVIEIQSEWSAHVIECWERLKMGETLAANSIGISIGGMREEQGLFEVWLEASYLSKETSFWSTCVSSLLKKLKIVEFSILEDIGKHTSVTVNKENFAKLLQALKPLSLRFRFDEVSLNGVCADIINYASELITSGSEIEVTLSNKKKSQFKSWLDFVRKVQPWRVYYFRLGDKREAEDFLFPLADLVEEIEITDATTDDLIDPPPVLMSTLKEIFRRKCTKLILEDDILPLEEAEQFAQLFNHLSKVCYLRMRTKDEEFDVNVGEYVVSSYSTDYDDLIVIFSPS